MDKDCSIDIEIEIEIDVNLFASIALFISKHSSFNPMNNGPAIL